MKQLSSFGARLVITVLVTATVAFTAFVGLTFFRLERGLERQAEQLGRLSELKLAQRLTSGNRLAHARLEMLFSDVQRQLANIAQRADVVEAVSSRNVVAMSEVLGRAADTADIDGILVVDARVHVIGRSGGKLGLLATNEAFQKSRVADQVREIAAKNDPTDRRKFRRIVELAGRMSGAVGAKTTAPLAAIVIEPVFDEFGDVFAALIAHRALRFGEAILQELSKLEGAGLLVLAGGLELRKRLQVRMAKPQRPCP